MEYYTNDHILEELLSVREMEHYYTNQESTDLDYFGSNINNDLTIPTTNDWNILPVDEISLFDSSSSSYAAFGHQLSPPHSTLDSSTFNQTLPYFSMPINLSDEYFSNEHGLLPNTDDPCKPEPESEIIPSFKLGPQVKKKPNGGPPSKNLMAERRRRKRLNDRLSMLRSVVPKISKMDRTSILGDTIDYMKELLDRINNLQQQMHLGPNPDQFSIMSMFNKEDANPNQILLRNSPKFEVERINGDTRIEICCGAKGGLLLSTVKTIEEALSLEIQHCVISCFNDFALQASCSQDLKKRAILDEEDIKQALLNNAGYRGKCLQQIN